MSTFKRSNWWLKEDTSTTNLRNPTIFWKINMITTISEIVSFQLCSSKHLKEDVANFLRSSMLHVRTISPKNSKPLLIFDNAPKNRSSMVFKFASDQLFVPVFITPGCPEQSFIENVFCTLKRKFSTEKNLWLINRAENSQEMMLEEILVAIKNTSSADMEKCRNPFLNELLQAFAKLIER